MSNTPPPFLTSTEKRGPIAELYADADVAFAAHACAEAPDSQEALDALESAAVRLGWIHDGGENLLLHPLQRACTRAALAVAELQDPAFMPMTPIEVLRKERLTALLDACAKCREVFPVTSVRG